MSKSTSRKPVTITHTFTDWELAVIAAEKRYMGTSLPRMTLEEYAEFFLRRAVFNVYEACLGDEDFGMPAGDPPADADVQTVLSAPHRERRRRLAHRQARQARAKVGG